MNLMQFLTIAAGARSQPISRVATSSNSNTGVSSWSVALPTGFKAGDLLILYLSTDTGGTKFASVPTGWTQLIGEGITAPDGQCFQVMYRMADGTETSITAATFNTNDWTVACECWRNVRKTGSINISGSNTNSSSNASPIVCASTGVTTTVPNTTVIYAVAPDCLNSGVTVNFTAPPGFGGDFQSPTNTFSGSVSVANKQFAAVGATGTLLGTLNLSSGNAGWLCAAIALTPVP